MNNQSRYILTIVLFVLALTGCVSSPAANNETQLSATTVSTATTTDAVANGLPATETTAPTEPATPPAAAAPTPQTNNLLLYASTVNLTVAAAPNGRMGRYFAFRTMPALPFLDPAFFDAFYGPTENMNPLGLFLLDFRPRLAPNGRAILLSGLTGHPDIGREGTGTWVLDLEAGTARRLLPDGKVVSWSPASDAIAYVEGDALYTLSTAEGAEPQLIFQHPDLWTQYAHWSPDGQWIAALTSTESDAFESGYAATYWLVPAAGGPARELTTQPASAIEYVSTDMAWSPDGQLLLARNKVFDLAGNRLSPDYPGRVEWLPGEATLLSNSDDGLRLLSVAGEEIARISEGYFSEAWAFARDGRRLAYALPRDEAGVGVAVYDRDSGENQFIGVMPGAFEVKLLRWSADDDQLVAGVFMGERHEIWTLAAEPGGAIERLLSDAELIEVFPYTPSPATTASPTRALTYDEFVEAMAALDRTLAANEPDTYAGYCFPVPGRREAAIAFTTNAEETARSYLAGRPYEAQVQVWTADYPLKLLKDNLRTEFERIIDLYSANGMGGSVDQCKNRIVIFVPSLATAEAAIEVSGTPLLDYVELIEDVVVEE